MKYRVQVDVIVDESSVEYALQETMMIVRGLCEHEDVWPKIIKDPRLSNVTCSVTKVSDENTVTS